MFPIFLPSDEPFYNFIYACFISEQISRNKNLRSIKLLAQLTITSRRRRQKGATEATKEVNDNVWISELFSISPFFSPFPSLITTRTKKWFHIFLISRLWWQNYGLWKLIRFRSLFSSLIHQIKHICCVEDFFFNTPSTRHRLLSFVAFLVSFSFVSFSQFFFFFSTKLIYVEENCLDCDPSNLIRESP